MKNSAIIGFMCLILAVGCTENVEPTPLEYYKIITGANKKTWRLSGISWTGDGKKDVNYSLPTCVKDDAYIFYANAERLYEVTNGAQKCDLSEPDKWVSDEWSFVNATSTLTIIMPLLSDGPLPFYVKRLTAKEMVLEIYIDQDSKYSYKITMQSVSEE